MEIEPEISQPRSVFSWPTRIPFSLKILPRFSIRFLRFGKFWWNLTRFYRVLPSFTSFGRMLLGFTWIYRVLPSFTGFDRIFLCLSWFYRVLPSFPALWANYTELNWVLRKLTGFQTRLIGFYRVLPNLTGITVVFLWRHRTVMDFF